MIAVRGFFVVLLAHQAMGGAVRSPPSFSKPVYSDSYLPAAMQVIFHAVDQLKQIQSDDTREAISSTTPISLSESSERTKVPSTTVGATTGQADVDKQEDEGSKYTTKVLEGSLIYGTQKQALMEAVDKHILKHIESSQTLPQYVLMDSEAIEKLYPAMVHLNTSNYDETNYEEPELEHSVPEKNEELPEVDYELDSTSIVPEASTGSIDVSAASLSSGSIVGTDQKKKEPTIDSVVHTVFEIVKPTPSGLADEIIEESKSAMGVSVEKLETLEDEEDENRFTRLGERVTQVPRPSLTSYLKRAKVPPRATLQQLANLYDSLSKDARKQGFGKYTGYSDEVLNTLETSAEGGVAPQLRKILDKVLERNELTREDAKTRTKQAVTDLDNPSSALSSELRTLLPLRYSP